MNWFLFALIPPALWSVTNHFDKYLISKYFKGGGVGALMIFSSLIGVVMAAGIALFHPEVLMTPPRHAFLIMMNGFIYILATLPYFYALQKDEASIAVPLFQMVPAFTYILAWITLGEQLSFMQLIGGVLVIAGAVGMSLEFQKGKKVRLKKQVLLYMALSSLLFALSFLLFKVFAIESSFWVTSFYEYIGFILCAVVLLVFVQRYRKEFYTVLRKNKLKVLSLNGINEIVNVVAKLSFNHASLLTPITLTWVVNGFQPFFVFLYGVLLTIFFPHITKENISLQKLSHKLLAITILFIGAYILNRG